MKEEKASDGWDTDYFGEVCTMVIEKEGGDSWCEICGKFKWFWQKLYFEPKKYGTCHLKCFRKLREEKPNPWYNPRIESEEERWG